MDFKSEKKSNSKIKLDESKRRFPICDEDEKPAKKEESEVMLQCKDEPPVRTKTSKRNVTEVKLAPEKIRFPSFDDDVQTPKKEDEKTKPRAYRVRSHKKAGTGKFIVQKIRFPPDETSEEDGEEKDMEIYVAPPPPQCPDPPDLCTTSPLTGSADPKPNYDQYCEQKKEDEEGAENAENESVEEEK